MAQSVADEVREILDEGRSGKSESESGALKEAVEMVRTHRAFGATLQSQAGAVIAALGEAAEKVTRGTNALDALRGLPREALCKLSETVDAALAHLDAVAGTGGQVTEEDQFVSAMAPIKPGDKIKLTQQVFRIIGKSGNSALMQPEAIARSLYGDFSPAPKSVKSPGDFSGRGGKDFGDAVVSQPQGMLKNPGGHISLVGTQVLKYNPHTGMFTFPSSTVPGDYEMADTIQIVGHDPTLPFIVGEHMTVERFDMMLDEAHGATVIDKLRVVAEGDSPMKVHGVYVDHYTAEAAVSMHDSLNGGNRERLAEMTVPQVLSVMFKMLGTNESLAEAKKGDKPDGEGWEKVASATSGGPRFFWYRRHNGERQWYRWDRVKKAWGYDPPQSQNELKTEEKEAQSVYSFSIDGKDGKNLKAGSKVRVRAHKSAPGKGLSYEAFSGTLADDARIGGWDVVDVNPS